MTLVETPNELVASLVGRTITAAVWFEHEAGYEGYDGGDHALVTLDDGRVIEFAGSGVHTDGFAIIEVRE